MENIHKVSFGNLDVYANCSTRNEIIDLLKKKYTFSNEEYDLIADIILLRINSKTYKFNEKGYDIEGLDKDGFNEKGWNKENINKRTKTKYDVFGKDIDGFNEKGWNIQGINKQTKTKYDKNGLDINGCDINGVNPNKKIQKHIKFHRF